MKSGFNIISSIVIFLFSGISAIAQDTRLIKIADLPARLYESSGLEYTVDSSGGNIWTIVDSNLVILFCLNNKGEVKKAVHINNLNRDWEDLTKDDLGNFYIGDFGNNLNKRQDLKIYKIPPPDSLEEKVITAEIISFHYSDQHGFPPALPQKNFDMEAMISFDSSLYLFSKNQTKPFSAYTKLYRLPNKPGNHAAELIDSIYLGPGHMYNTWVTAADVSPDKKTLALLTHDKVWLFTCFDGNSFFKGQKKTIELNHFSQKEGLCFMDNETLIISDERTQNILGGCLYQLKLNKDEHGNCK